MHYAQSPECRMQRLLTYFGQSTLDTCGHCDNRLQREQRTVPAAPRLQPKAWTCKGWSRRSAATWPPSRWLAELGLLRHLPKLGRAQHACLDLAEAESIL